MHELGRLHNALRPCRLHSVKHGGQLGRTKRHFQKARPLQNLELYFNDDLKINNRLTLNLGVRYSYLPNPYQANDQLTIFNQAAFEPGLGNASCNGLFYSAGLLANPCPPGAGGLPGPNRAIQNNYVRGIAPRLGVAWDPTGSGKWAICGYSSVL